MNETRTRQYLRSFNMIRSFSRPCFVSLQKSEEVEEGKHPLQLSWPPTARKRFTYIALMPIILPLWLTLPDTRRQVSSRVADELCCCSVLPGHENRCQ